MYFFLGFNFMLKLLVKYYSSITCEIVLNKKQNREKYIYQS